MRSQIAVLYVVGLATNVFATVLTVHLVAKYGRRLICLYCVGIGSLACLLKFSDNYAMLLVGRVLDGLAAAFLTAPFQQWYTHEHISAYDFPKEWIVSTFRLVTVGAGFLAVSAGYMAEFAESISSITAFPFFFAIIFLLAGGAYMGYAWQENRLEPELRIAIGEQLSRAVKTLGKQPLTLVLCVVHCLFESTVHLFIFVWTPLFLHAKSLTNSAISFGGIYSALMASALVGSLCFRVLNRRYSAYQLLAAASAAALLALGCSLWIIPGSAKEWTLRNFDVLLMLFCSYELAVGLYLPAMNRLQNELIPGEQRTALLALFRLPLNAISAIGLFMWHGRESGDWQIVALACTLLGLSSFSCIVLAIVQHRRMANVDHFVITVETGGQQRLIPGDNVH